MIKKAEITVTTLFYTILISLAVLTLFGSIVNNIINNYNKPQAIEFSNFEAEYYKFNESAKSMIGSQDITDSNNTFSNWFVKINDNIQNAYLDSTIGRALNTVGKFMSTGKDAVKSTSYAITSTKYIPNLVAGLIITLILIVGVFTFAKALWEKKL